MATDLLNSGAPGVEPDSAVAEADARVERQAESTRQLEERVSRVEADTRALVACAHPNAAAATGTSAADAAAAGGDADGELERAAREQLEEVTRRENALLEREATRLRHALDAVRAGFEQLSATHLNVCTRTFNQPDHTVLSTPDHRTSILYHLREFYISAPLSC